MEDGIAPLTCEARNGNAETCLYSGAILCEYSGQYGYTLRIVPSHAELAARLRGRSRFSVAKARYHVGLVHRG